MTASMRVLYDYLLEERLTTFQATPRFRQNNRRLARLEQALLSSFTAEQQALAKEYQALRCQQEHWELESVFEAAWVIARELA